MLLKIVGRPIGEAKHILGRKGSVNVFNADTGEDITDGLRSAEIFIGADEVVTAKLEYCVTELDLDKVKADDQ